MEVAAGIHQVDGWGMSNGYVVETDDGLLAVDVWSAGHTLDTIRALGRPAQDLMLIVITHWHADHVRGAAELRRRTGARVAVHELDAAVLAGGALGDLPSGAQQGAARPCPDQPEPRGTPGGGRRRHRPRLACDAERTRSGR